MISIYVDLISVYISSFITTRSHASHIIYFPVRIWTKISTLELNFETEIKEFGGSTLIEAHTKISFYCTLKYALGIILGRRNLHGRGE